MRWLAAILLLGSAWAQSALVFPPQGLIEGRINQAAQVAYFLGIPYATAERWKAPQPVLRHPKPLQATAPTTACPQRGVFTTNFGGYLPPESEDCLNLAVWMPVSSPPVGGWPVIVWIHGGSFTGGSWAEPVYDGTQLAAKGAVVVGINYRLGPLGFLALPALKTESADGSYGNYGLLDQVEALYWVQRNIAAFGGNPQNVTIMGQSAGGMAVCSLLASSKAQGLFTKAILMSGGCEYVRTPQADLSFLQNWANLMGCPDAALACLRSVPLERMFPTTGPALAQLEQLERVPFAELPWKPHIDGVVLRTTPLQALQQGYAAGIPLLAGGTFQESWGDVAGGPPSWPEFVKRVEQSLPGRGAAVQAFYQTLSTSPQEAWGYFQTDRVLLCPSLEAAWAQQPHTPSYAYLQTYITPLWPQLGSFHGIDMPLLFGTQNSWPSLALFLTPQARESSEPITQDLQRRFVAFASNANPGPDWPQATQGQKWRFGAVSQAFQSNYPERCALVRR